MEEKQIVKVTSYENVDFSKMSRDKLFSLVVELIKENKMQRQEIAKLSGEVKSSDESKNSIRRIIKSYDAKLDFLIERLCPNFLNEIDSGKEISAEVKVYTIIDEVLKNKKYLIEQITSCRQKIKEQKELLEELKAKLIKSIENSNAIVYNDKEEDVKDEPVVNVPKETPSKPSSSNIEIVAMTVEEETEDEIKKHIELKPVNFAQIIESLDDISKMIIKLIGSEGISEHPEIMKRTLASLITANDSKFETAFNKLATSKIIISDVVNSMNRPRGTRIANLSNDIGKVIYKRLYGKDAVVSEKEIMIKENDNLQHGYSIKDVATVLNQLDYTDISYARKTNTITFDGQRSWIPDVIAKNPISKRLEYFEVELGNHNVKNFEDKMNKANQKASVLKIIVPNKTIKSLLIEKVNNWTKNLKRPTSLKVYVLTFNELRLKDNIEIVAINSEEDI